MSAQAPELPLWVEYAKALGAPLAALIAASIAGWMAYRQWSTARNKLKLDFFDRRVEIYIAAIDVIGYMAEPDGEKIECFAELRKHTATARWLLHPDVATYLTELSKRARLADANEPSFKKIFDDGGKEALLKSIQERTRRRNAEIAALDKLFDTYLSVRH